VHTASRTWLRFRLKLGQPANPIGHTHARDVSTGLRLAQELLRGLTHEGSLLSKPAQLLAKPQTSQRDIDMYASLVEARNQELAVASTGKNP
jgi:hypothetical protein